jgi:hypothetical protein
VQKPEAQEKAKKEKGEEVSEERPVLDYGRPKKPTDWKRAVLIAVGLCAALILGVAALLALFARVSPSGL